MKAFKLTNEKNQTHGPTQWGPGVTHEAPGNWYLDGPSWLYFSASPEAAILMNPGNANIVSPVLWEAEAEGRIMHDGPRRSGCTRLTTLNIIPAPEFTTRQRVAFGILCALEVCNCPALSVWAETWLRGENRSAKVAADTANMLEDGPNFPGGWAAGAAHLDATARVPQWLVWSAVTRAADGAITVAEREHRTLDLVAVAKKALIFS